MNNNKRVQDIKLIIFNIDGVLTDGRIIIGTEGEALKVFWAHDGIFSATRF